jgi:hypothetical protein
MSLLIDLFDAYHQNLTSTGNNPDNKDIMLCPLCLKEIPRLDIESGAVSLEHIIPQHSTSSSTQNTRHTQIGVKNVRSGLTVTCPVCNGKKGRELDFCMRNLITPGQKTQNDYSPRTGVAILIYSYLFAFAVHGYEYILASKLKEIRKQFNDPDGCHTSWSETACVHLVDPQQPIICNAWGYPFIMGGMVNGPLEIMFWRFRALLPSASHVTKAVEIPESLRILAHSDD